MKPLRLILATVAWTAVIIGAFSTIAVLVLIITEGPMIGGNIGWLVELLINPLLWVGIIGAGYLWWRRRTRAV